MPRIRIQLLICAMLLVSAAALAVHAQQTPPAPAGGQAVSDENWKPEKLENLKVLPKTTTPDEIIKIMRGFNETLNVECHFCHKGKMKAPLSTFDFPDDSKEHKEVTRNMLTMTNDINTKYPEGMGDDATVDAPKVTCATCHRRNRHPETDLPAKPAK
jgi:hypothetical protein